MTRRPPKRELAARVESLTHTPHEAVSLAQLLSADIVEDTGDGVVRVDSHRYQNPQLSGWDA